MFTSRLLVGLGEAALAPCAVSMIADIFPPQKRGRPISIYLLGQSIAGGLSVLITGATLSAVPAGKLVWISWFDGLAAWRVAFILAGVAGLPVILTLLSYREPARRGAQLRDGSNSVGHVAAYLRRNRQVFLPFYLGFSMVAMTAYSINAWGATYLMRQFVVGPAEVGKWMGLVGIVLGVIGPLVAGLAVDRVSQRYRTGSKLLYLSVVALLMIPATLVVLMPKFGPAIVAMGAVSLVLPCIGTATITGVQEMVPANMRGVGVSLFSLFNTITGQTLGPFLVAAFAAPAMEAAVTTGVGAGRPLEIALAMVSLPAILLASALFFAALRGAGNLLAREGELATIMGSGGQAG